MFFADGMEKAMRIQEGFAEPADAAAYWAEGAASVPFEDLTYPGAEGQDQAARLYRGSKSADGPVLLYIHGGGWISGSIAANEWSSRALATGAGWNVLAISYRLAPQHTFPAGLNDCRAAMRWLHSNAASLGLAQHRIALGGSSAGANLAVATVLADDPIPLAGILLFHGVFSCDLETASYKTYRDGPGMTLARMQMLFATYDPDGHRTAEPLIAPLQSNALHKLPRSYLIAAQHDVLLDDTTAMTVALQAADVAVELHVEPGVTHGYVNRGRLVPAANASLARAASFLAELKD